MTPEHDPNALKSADARYLEQLAFTPEVERTWLRFFVRNVRVIVLLILLITLGGVTAYVDLPLESNPEVKIPIGVVVTAYPGVSPSDIEALITEKVEAAVSGLSGIDRLTSSSSTGISVTTVEFESGEDVDDAIRRLRERVATIQNQLPDDAFESTVQEIAMDNTPIWTFQLAGPSNGLQLRDDAEDLADVLERIPGVREVEVSGGLEREIEIAIDPEALLSRGLAMEEVLGVVSATNLVIPAGSYSSATHTFSVRTDGRIDAAATIAALPVRTIGETPIRVGDIARVTERAAKQTTYSRLSLKNQEPLDSVTLSVFKRTGGSVIDVVDAGKQAVDAAVAKMSTGTTYATVIDMSTVIRRDYNQLVHDFFLTLALVGGLLFLIVGLKEAFVAILAVPLVFCISFVVMLQTGTSLNFLSMFSLILSLGLLVDDAIVVVSATKMYLNSGKFTPEEAVLLVLNDFKLVLTTTTLTTVWAFLPLLLASGIIGLFIRSIPITVSVTLIASLLVALMVNHPLAAVLERIRFTTKIAWTITVALLVVGALLTTSGMVVVGAILLVAGFILGLLALTQLRMQLRANSALVRREKHDDAAIKEKLRTQAAREDHGFFDRLVHGIIHFDQFLPPYEKALRFFLATRLRRFLALGFAFLLFLSAVALPVTGILRQEFFPVANVDTITVQIEAPIGTALDATDAIVRELEPKFWSIPEISRVATLVGTVGSSGGLEARISQALPHMASITLDIGATDTRERASYEITPDVRALFANEQRATVTIKDQRGGPPSGADVEIRVSGDDLPTLEKTAEQLLPTLAAIPGVLNAQTSLDEAPGEYTFRVDPLAAQRVGVTTAQVGSFLRMALTGLDVSTVLRGGDEIPIRARVASERLPSLAALQDLRMTTRVGPVPIAELATVDLTPAVGSISRVDQRRTVLLSSSVSGSTSPAAVVSAFQKAVAAQQLPPGTTLSYGGENEQNQESVLSILRAMALAMLLIIATMVIQFNSFRKAAIVLVTIPLALTGVFYGLTFAGIPLTFPGLIGILALFGIVVKNAIILIDKMHLNAEAGIPFIEAIVQGGKARLEAIFITSLSTILGIIPITLSNETWLALGGAIISGLALSSFFTLFVVPLLVATLVPEDSL